MKNKTFIVAEISANHNQNYEYAEKLVRCAKEVGADAVKLQTYTPDTLTIKCDKPEFKIKGTIWDGKTLYDLYSEAYMPWAWQSELKKVADDIGIELFSTPFDKTSVDFLENIGVKRYKVASFEIVDIPLLEYIASKNKPVIISTGMASKDEIKDAIQACYNAPQINLLRCVSSYPTKISDMNLSTIDYLIKSFGLPVGLSDHTLSIDIPMLAVVLGASIIEKHITLSRDFETPDSKFSLEPYEFKKMVDKVRVAEKVLGDREIKIADSESDSKVFRRSLFVVEDMKCGELFSCNNVRSIRPCNGLSPKYINKVIGKRASKDIERGTPLTWDLLN